MKGDETPAAKELKSLTSAVGKLATTLDGLAVRLKKFDNHTDDEKVNLVAAIASAELASGGRLALGWEHWPFCTEDWDTRCDPMKPVDYRSPTFWSWIAGCLFMSFLAGLGAPFWYDLIKAVARARRTVRDPSTTLK